MLSLSDKVTDKYIELGEIKANGGHSFEDLKERLEAEGQLKGVDAIINLEKKDHTIYSYSTPVVEIYSIKGTGIKFIDSINYLDQFVRRQEIFLYNKDSASYQINSIIYFNLWGVSDSMIGDLDMENYIYEISLDHITSEVNKYWKYRYEPYNVPNKLVVRKKYNKWGQILRRYRLEFDKKDRLRYAKLKRYREWHDRKEIYFTYVDDKLTMKKILHNGKKLIQTFTYTKKGLLKTSEIKVNGKSFLKICYHYFDNADLPEILATMEMK